MSGTLMPLEMLRSQQAIVRFEDGIAMPDRLTRVSHKHYLGYAMQMLAVYRAGVGRSRKELHQAIKRILANEPDCEPRRIASFCKVLDDLGEFDTDRRGEAARLRLKLFTAAAKYHPLVTEPDGMFERSEREAKSLLAADLGKTWAEIEAALYVDVVDRQPLRAFDAAVKPEDLLSRYNLAQLQACLYQCQRLTVEATTDFAAIVRYAKLCRLLVQTRRISAGYLIELSGPMSVLQETRRYGVNFARFVSALVSCRGWRMSAAVTTPWGRPATLRLHDKSGYRSHIASPSEFDSEVEARLFADWGEVQDGWRLHREAGILQYGQTTFVPDFLLKHEDGREVFLEVVGFWTPEYLAAKRETIRKFRDQRILLAVQSKQAKADAAELGAVVYKTRIDPQAIVKATESLIES
jgi:hypothetical protein